MRDGIFPISTQRVRVGKACPGFISQRVLRAFDRSFPSAVSSSPFDIRAVMTDKKDKKKFIG